MTSSGIPSSKRSRLSFPCHRNNRELFVSPHSSASCVQSLDRCLARQQENIEGVFTLIETQVSFCFTMSRKLIIHWFVCTRCLTLWCIWLLLRRKCRCSYSQFNARVFWLTSYDVLVGCFLPCNWRSDPIWNR